MLKSSTDGEVVGVAQVGYGAGSRLTERALVLALALLLAMSLHLALVQKINWDEFYYLSRVYAFQNGELTRALQNFHVHLFGWLTGLDGTEIDQIRAGRVIMWLCQVGTVGAIYVVARTFFDRVPALFACLVYMAMHYTMLHGTSFRTDPPAAFLMMICLALLIKAPLTWWSIVVFAVLSAVAVLITAKVVFFLPAFLGAGIWRLQRSQEPGRTFAMLILTVFGSLCAFAVLFLWHQSTLSGSSFGTENATMRSSATRTLLDGELFPAGAYLKHNAILSISASLSFVLGSILFVLTPSRNGFSPGTKLVVLLMAAPLLSFVFYRNAFPYFFPFIFPPAVLLAAMLFHRIQGAVPRTVFIMLILAETVLVSWMPRQSERLDHQQAIVRAVHEVFPEPVHYFDRSGVLPSFPRVGFFMSTWGLSGYVAGGRPVFERYLENQTVPLLLLNSPSLENAMGIENPDKRYPLLDADKAILRDSFIPHWGPIWVAGKELIANPTGMEFTIHVPGDYIVETTSTSIAVNGIDVAPGAVITLERGAHVLTGDAGEEVVLRWSEADYKPDTAPPEKAFFTGF